VRLLANNVHIGFIRQTQNRVLRRALAHFNGLTASVDLASLHAARTAGFLYAQITIRDRALLYEV